MYIRHLRVSRFRHITDTEIGPLAAPPASSDLVALVGPNGSGKSSVLELIGHALSNSWSLTWRIRRSFPQSSFEVDIGLTESELALLSARSEDLNNTQQRAFHYLQANKRYSRSFGFDDGAYAEDPPLHNAAHFLVTSTLRDHHNRALGFFLRSNRTYPVTTYQPKKLIQNTQRTTLQHVWNLAFNTSDVQYQDTYDFLVEQQYHYDRRLGSYYRRESACQLEDGESLPTDPMAPYDELLSRLFPGHALAEPPADIPDNLYVALPTGDKVPFRDLSSGEKEVFFILSFFLRNDVRDAIVVLDEPELHLHPELGRLLIRTIQEIRPRNQVWIATHSGEIIDEAGRDRVFLLDRREHGRTVRVTPATDDSRAARLLRELFGFSGYVGVGRAMVFTEGRGSSLDRKVFARLFSTQSGAVRVIPAGGSDSLPRINAAILEILNATFSTCEFFLIRDRDYLTDVEVEAMESRGEGRLWVLNRNQIENYLLNSEWIATVESEILDCHRSPEQVEAGLTTAARRIAGETLREMLSFRMNRMFSPQDFSLGQLLQGQLCIDRDGNWDEERMEALSDRFVVAVEGNRNRLGDVTSRESITEMFLTCQTEIGEAVRGDEWRRILPGKRLLGVYARQRGYARNLIPAFVNSLVRQLGPMGDNVPQDLQRIIEMVVAD